MNNFKEKYHTNNKPKKYTQVKSAEVMLNVGKLANKSLNIIFF